MIIKSSLQELIDTMPSRLGKGSLLRDGYYCVIGWGLHLAGIKDEQIEGCAKYFNPDPESDSESEMNVAFSALATFANAFDVNISDAFDIMSANDKFVNVDPVDHAVERDRVIEKIKSIRAKTEG